MAKTKPKKILEVVQDSTASKVEITIADEDDAAIDVSGGSGVLFHARKKVGGSWVKVVADAVAAFVDAANGVVEYQLTSTEVGEPADLHCEFEVSDYSGTDPLVTKTFIVRVLERNKMA